MNKEEIVKRNLLFFCIVLLSVAFIFSACSKNQERKLTEGEVDSTEEKVAAGSEDEFSADGWETNKNPVLYGDPRAKKGGSITFSWSKYVSTLRTMGSQSNQDQIRWFENLIYEPLLNYDTKTMTFTPRLATHWKRAEDDSWYEFRLDPEAKWSDGKPVTSDDIIATINLLKDPGIGSAYANELYGRFDVEKKSDLVFRVTNSDPNWRHFLYLATSNIHAAHYLDKIDGATYLEKYNDQMLPGSGPYIADMDKIVPGELFVIKRRPDYWAAKKKENVGLYNFDEIRFMVIRDQVMEKEKFKKGDIDIYIVSRAQWWKEEFDLENPQPAFDALHRGIVQRRKIFSFEPKGVSGLAFNMREFPFDDIRMRKAFAMLWDFETLNKTLFFGEYAKTNSLYQGTCYMGPKRYKPSYDPKEANRLLDEMGWEKRNSNGYRINSAGEELAFDLPLPSYLERIMTPLQEDLKDAGIKMNIQISDGNTIWERVNERRFSVAFMAFTGLFIPNPVSSLHSSLADEMNTNNLQGFKNERVDELMDLYDTEKDPKKRIEYIQEIDEIVSKEVIWAYGWHAPFTQRVLFWNKFDMPKWCFSYDEDYKDISHLWWYDPDKEAEMEKAKKDSSIFLDYGPQDIDYWKVREAK